jgi:hypothetical protein
LAILSPWILTWRFKPYDAETDSHGSLRRIGSFFAIPYITWWLLHYIIATLGIVAVVALAVDGVLDKSVVSALLGGLFGYVLGSSSRGGQAAPATAATSGTPATPPGLRITNIQPGTGKAAGGEPVSIVGSGFAQGATVIFGTAPAPAVVTSSTVISAVTPPGSSHVDVTVQLPDGSKATSPATSGFTYG